MKKFLSILMLACLLAVGMALPAAAEGEETPTELYAQFEDSDEYVKELTIPADLRKEIFFFTKEGDSYKPVTSIPAAADSSVVEIKKELNVPPLVVTGKSAGVAEVALRDSEGNPTSDTVKINVVESHLEIKRRSETNWSTSLSGIRVNESVAVDVRLGANGDFELWTTKMTPSEGLTLDGDWIVAETAGTKYLTYNQYRVSIEVSGNEIQIPSDQDKLAAFLSALKNQREFDSLIDGKYFGGDLTFVLPAADLGSVVCNVQLPNGGEILLKGVSGTKMTDLIVNSGNVNVEGITFTGDPGISLKNTNKCEVSDCIFNSLPFRIQMDEDGNAPQLVLKGNVFTGTAFAEVFDYQNSEVGKWLASPKSKPEIAALDLGVIMGRFIDGSEVKAIEFNVDYSVNSVIDEGWTLKFRFPCSFDSAYAAHNGVAGEGVFESASRSKSYIMSIFEGGRYAVISGSYPKIVKGNVEIRPVDAEYLWPIIVDTTLTGATVTYQGKQVPASINNKKLTFFPNGAGTYKVASASAATGNSQPVKRNYKYTYQDYYQVTPAGFTNAMRYVKDNLVTLNCTEAGSRSISLPVASMAAAAEKGYSVLVKTKNAELTLDAAALKSIAQQAKGTTVLLHYKSLNHKTLTTVGQASIQSHLAQFPGDNADLAFLVTATSDSETIEDLQMGTITLKIPFILLPGTEDMANTVYALQSESIAEARETTVADGHLTTKLLDLTEHMVFLTAEAAQPTEETTEATEETTEPTEETIVETTQPETVPETTQPVEAEKQGGSLILTLVIGLGVVLVIGGGALGFLILRRRSRK